MKLLRQVLGVFALLAFSLPALASFTNTTFEFSSAGADDANIQVILVPAEHGELSLAGWSNETAAHVNRALDASEFEGKAQQRVEVLAPAGLSVSRLVVLGLGDTSELKRTTAEEMGAALAVYVNGTKADKISINSSLIDNAAEHVAAIAHGVQLRNYSFDRFKSEPAERPSQTYVWQVADSSDAEQHFAKLDAIAQGVFLARELTNLPGSSGYPEAFANIAKEMLEPLGVKITILGPEEIKALNMGALYGVSQGSQHKARLLVMHWEGSDDAPYALVGKGNTFDTGGYNLKTSSSSILRMQTDKAGGAAVVGALKALAGQQAPVNVVGVVPLSQNKISGEAQLPGDVVMTGAGITVEVANTDAEGRLILADGVWYAREHFNPKAIADIATLTGAKVGALGTEYSAVFSEQDYIVNAMRKAGEAVNENVWQLPLSPYEDTIKSRIADIRNVGSPGATAGALFIKQFAGDTPWIHVDMAGNALIDGPKGIHPRGATGYGVRLLTEWVHTMDRDSE